MTPEMEHADVSGESTQWTGVVMRRHKTLNHKKLNSNESKNSKSMEEFHSNPHVRVAEEENVDL